MLNQRIELANVSIFLTNRLKWDDNGRYGPSKNDLKTRLARVTIIYL